jgi:hypothetical protein
MRNRFQNLPTEDLLDLLIVVTRQLLAAVDCQASDGEVNAKRKELELIQEEILKRKPQHQIEG